MYFHVPSAHLALVTAPVTCVWFCSIPAPNRSSVGEQSNDWAFAAAVPRTPDNMGVHSFALGWGWPPADQFVIFFHLCLQNDVFSRRTREARHLCHLQDMSPETLIHELFLSCFCWPLVLSL